MVGLILHMKSLGTTDLDFYLGIQTQLTRVCSGDNESEINFLLSVVENIKPRDHLETLLAAQMATIHASMMNFAKRLARAEDMLQRDSAERAVNKLARTFAAQMETLKRYRVDVEPKATVQNVVVGDGGQAIVGNVTRAPREAQVDKIAVQSSDVVNAIASTSLIENKSDLIRTRNSARKNEI